MKSNEIGMELALLSHAIKRRMESECSGELVRLSIANGYILAFLHENMDRDVFQRDFEEAFGITRSTASKTLSLMDCKGLITREPVPGDARLKKIGLTELGERMRMGMISCREAVEKQLTTGFSEDELNILKGYLERMRSNMKK